MKRIAVFFPGIGYTTDRPLLHYSRRLAQKGGYEIVPVNYSGFPDNVKGNKDKMKRCCEIAFDKAKEILKDINFAEYDEILFVAKSVGTVVAINYANSFNLIKKTKFVLYTPVEYTLNCRVDNAIVFTGSNDPWISDKNYITEKCREYNIPCYVIKNANHSLETDCIIKDIENMNYIMKITGGYINEENQSWKQ